MFQLELFECKIGVYSCLEITRVETTLQASEIVDKVLCWVLFFVFFILFDIWRGKFSIVIGFFGHPIEVYICMNVFEHSKGINDLC